MQDSGLGEQVNKARQQVQSKVTKNVQIHGYKLAKLSALGFLIGMKALFKQVMIVLSEIFRPGSTRRY